MGLAILELDDEDSAALQFGVDTGTNRWFRIQFGRRAGKRDGFDSVEDLVYATPLAVNPKAGWTFDTRIPVRVPASPTRGASYAQLLSFKDQRGRSPAFSSALRIAVGGGADGTLSHDGFLALSQEAAMIDPTFQRPRQVPCRTSSEAFSLPPLVGSVLGELVKLAGPLVGKLLNPADGGGTGGTASGSTVAPGAPEPAAQIVTDILRAVLTAITSPAPAQVSSAKSLVADHRAAGATGNRFAGPFYSRPQVFGIDDALLASMIGPVLQVLPQLLNAAADEKLKLRQENNKLITNLMSGLERRRLMELLAQARASSPNNPALAALTGLFEGEAGAAAIAAPGAPATSGQASLPPPLPVQGQSQAPVPPPATGSRAVLSFLLPPGQQWYGELSSLYARGTGLTFRVQLDVGPNGPKAPLARAIAHLCIKDDTERVLYQGDYRFTDISPGTPIPLALDPGEVSHLPANTRLTLAVQLRWPGSRAGLVYQASAVAGVVLVEKYFMAGLGGQVDGDRELVDMATYRPFWNKVWESPTLHAADGDGSSHWDLDAALKYSVIFAPDQAANGLMETRALTAAPDPASPVARTEGRFKGGIELSVSEVNKLLPLWPGQAPLPPEQVAAFATEEFARGTSGEMIRALRLKGSKRQRGLVWVVPVFSLHDFTLGVVSTSDAFGQVTSATQEQVRFPVPSAVRVLTMKSEG